MVRSRSDECIPRFLDTREQSVCKDTKSTSSFRKGGRLTPKYIVTFRNIQPACVVGRSFTTLFSNCLFSPFSAPLTDKPPKILFPSENKISNMELQLGKSILGFPPAAVSAICVILQNDRKPSPTHLQAPSTD